MGKHTPCDNDTNRHQTRTGMPSAGFGVGVDAPPALGAWRIGVSYSDTRHRKKNGRGERKENTTSHHRCGWYVGALFRVRVIGWVGCGSMTIGLVELVSTQLGATDTLAGARAHPDDMDTRALDAYACSMSLMCCVVL